MRFAIPFFLIAAIIAANGEDWTTSNGTTYKNVSVVKVDSGVVTVHYADGSAEISLSKLPQEIQQRLISQETAQAIPLPQIPISGQVFVVTRGGLNFKLGAIHVRVYKFDEVAPVIKKKLEEAAPQVDKLHRLINKLVGPIVAIDESVDNSVDSPNWQVMQSTREKADAQFNDIKSKYYYLLSKDYYLANLPAPIAYAETDADGKFATKVLKEGAYVITAQATREVIGFEEQYWWIVKIEVSDSSGKFILLTNDNMTSSKSPDSLVNIGN